MAEEEDDRSNSLFAIRLSAKTRRIFANKFILAAYLNSALELVSRFVDLTDAESTMDSKPYVEHYPDGGYVAWLPDEAYQLGNTEDYDAEDRFYALYDLVRGIREWDGVLLDEPPAVAGPSSKRMKRKTRSDEE